MTFRATISYDGTNYFGWQTTKMGPSVQETLSQAILAATQENVIPEAASRTDRGVHAKGQVIAFALEKEWKPFRLLNAVNAHLPKDIRIVAIDTAPSDFHPTLSAKEKRYRYQISCIPFQHPIHRLYAWHLHTPLNFCAMEASIPLLLGTHDFSSFSTGLIKNPICTLSAITIEHLERGALAIWIQGDRFLYKMVRTLVGTLVYIGQEKLPPEQISRLLKEKNRAIGGVTAPPHGLFLHEVLY